MPKREKPTPSSTDVIKLRVLHMKRIDSGNQYLVGSARCWLNGLMCEYSILKSKKPEGPEYWVSPPGRRATGGRWIPIIFLDEPQMQAVSAAVLSIWARYEVICTYHDLHKKLPDEMTLRSLMEAAELDDDGDNLRIAVESLMEEFTL